MSERAQLVGHAIERLGYLSRDGLTMAGRLLERAGISLPTYETLVARDDELAAKGDPGLEKGVIALREATKAALRTFLDAADMRDPWGEAARSPGPFTEQLTGARDRIWSALASAQGALAAESPAQEPLAVARDAVQALLSQGRIKWVDILDQAKANLPAAARTALEEAGGTLAALAAALEGGDVEGAREALSAARAKLAEAAAGLAAT